MLEALRSTVDLAGRYLLTVSAMVAALLLAILAWWLWQNLSRPSPIALAILLAVAVAAGVLYQCTM